MEVTTTDVRL